MEALTNVENYVILFFIYACLGWIMEIIHILITQRKLVNRGFLIGPYCPIYGYGAILMTLLLSNLEDYPILLFILGLLICSLLEYLTSFFMEKLFHARWWDYSHRKFNINGRICLSNMIAFGLLGCIVMYVLNPFFIEKIHYIPSNILNILCGVFSVIYIIDNILSINIIKNIQVAKELIKDNTEEIKKKVMDEASELANKIKSSKEEIAGKISEGKLEFSKKIENGKYVLVKKVTDNKEQLSKKVKLSQDELTKKVKEFLLNKSIFTRRIAKAFPNMKIITKKFKDNINKKENKTLKNN
ncbi:MAG: hypothetical protein IKN74_00015 [Clostridia bacterium]|nr:hypothetical protein [Clostridia bacterium]